MKNKLFPVSMAAVVNFLLFIPFVFIFKPIYNTNEDVYILYLLSGGFGYAPTEVLHYNYGNHPYLNLFIKNLFVSYPNVNWYSIILLLSHYLASCIILSQLIKRSKKIHAFIFYITLFIIFEAKFLLHINHTNTAIILTCSAVILSFTSDKNKKLTSAVPITAVMILLYASFFRIHVLIPLIGMSFPFLFLKSSRNKFITTTLALALTSSLIILFNHFHQSYYKSAIDNWQQEENYRQKVYSFYNHHKLNKPVTDTKWDTEINILTHGSPIDTNFISSRKLIEMRKDLLDKKNDTPISLTNKNWFWINNRIYFSVIVLLIVLSLQTKKLFFASIISLSLIIAGLYFLSVNAKLPEYLKISTLFLFGLFIVSASIENQLSNRYTALLSSAMLLLLIWGSVQLYKINKKNIREIEQFRLSAQEISAHSDKLFVLTADIFPLQKFYAFDNPHKFPLPNFLGAEHFLQNIYHPVFERFQLSSLKDLPKHQNVLFWGVRVPALENYFRLVNGRDIFISQPLKEFQYGEVRYISFK